MYWTTGVPSFWYSSSHSEAHPVRLNDLMSHFWQIQWHFQCISIIDDSYGSNWLIKSFSSTFTAWICLWMTLDVPVVYLDIALVDWGVNQLIQRHCDLMSQSGPYESFTLDMHWMCHWICQKWLIKSFRRTGWIADGSDSNGCEWLTTFSECCSLLQCVAVCCSWLQCVAACYIVLQLVAACCSAMQYAAVHCNVLRCVAVCGSDWFEPFSECCSLLQCGIVHCNVLQCVAVCCGVLQGNAQSRKDKLQMALANMVRIELQHAHHVKSGFDSI